MEPLAILLVEDDLHLRSCLAELLSSTIHRVTAVETLRHAREQLQGSRFDVLVTDILLADGDGLELIQEAKVREPELRIVAMSGGGDFLPPSYCLSLAVAFGAIAPLIKPFRFEQLLRAIEGGATPSLDHAYAGA
jgi:DNA-binding NtrC family response regulator